MLKLSKDWIAYTLNKCFAEKFKVKDNKPVHFIKDERIKEYLQRFWSYKRFYKKIDKYYVLPPAKGFIVPKKKLNLFDTGNLYDRQKDAIQFILDTYNQWKKSCFLTSWTGTWKGHILPALIKSMEWLRVVVIAPNDVVWSRIMDDLHMAKYVRWKKVLDCKHDVIVTLYRTFNIYKDHFNSNYDVVIIDEWHHVWWDLEDTLYIWKWFICWMSATPYRNEYNYDWFQMFFGNMLDTNKKALPIKVFEYKYKYEYSKEDVVKVVEDMSTTSPEVYRRLIINNKERYEHLAMIIENIESKWFKNFIVFSDRIEHIKTIEEVLRKEFPNKYIVVIKWESDVLSIMEELKNKQDIIIIWSNAVVKEWMNVPQLEVWILFVSAAFRWWIDQMAGRVNRFYWDKKFWYFIDFQDEISIWWSKSKKLWVYSRRKAYKEFWWPVWDLVNDFISVKNIDEQ